MFKNVLGKKALFNYSFFKGFRAFTVKNKNTAF